MARFLLLPLLLAMPVFGLAQKEAAIWYFGNNAGLDFRTGTPRPLFDGLVNTIEGCESYSDGEGNLLFYTDGKTVWNRDHGVMENGTGLRSSFSTAQAALVVPLPGSPEVYYIFTPDDALSYNDLQPGGSNGFNYSILDMRLDQGRGDVVQKNRELLENAAENVTAVRNFEGDFYWVLTHYIDRFYAYRLGAGGLVEQPVVSRVGPSINGVNNVRGNIKISPDGTRVAIAHNVLEPQYESHLYLYDFDANTGRLSNPRQLGPGRLHYGVEFSPDSSKLYASGMPITTDAKGDPALEPVEILQFDLGAPDIASSEFRLHRFNRILPGWISGALQLGIDKKIYHSIPETALSVIRSPNNAGILADFRPFAAGLGDRRATYGLPPYIQSFFETIVEIDQFCLGQPTDFTIRNRDGIASVSWDFGDPGSGGANTSSEYDPSHTFSNYGVFEVRLEVTYTDGSRREFVEFVEIAQVPELVPEVTLTQCDIDGVDDGISVFNLRRAIPLFNQGNPDINAYFFETLADAEANTNFLDPEAYRNLVPGQILYARAYENPDCPAIIAVRLETTWAGGQRQVESVPICLERPPAIALEFDATQLFSYLEARYPNSNISVFRMEEDALLEREPVSPGPVFLGPFDSNRFWYRVAQGARCEDIGIVDLDFRNPPEIEASVTASLCDGRTELQGPGGFDDYIWEDGTLGPRRTITEPGTYLLTLFSGGCSAVQTFDVVVPETFKVRELRIRDFQDRNSLEVLIEDAATPVRFSLDGGLNFQAQPRFENLLPGVYQLVIADDCRTVEETVVIGGLPKFFTPNGDGFNDRWRMPRLPGLEGYRIRIFDRYGNLLAVMDESHHGWDGTAGGRILPAADYWYRLELAEGRVIRGHFALRR